MALAEVCLGLLAGIRVGMPLRERRFERCGGLRSCRFAGLENACRRPRSERHLFMNPEVAIFSQRSLQPKGKGGLGGRGDAAGAWLTTRKASAPHQQGARAIPRIDRRNLGASERFQRPARSSSTRRVNNICQGRTS